MAQVHLPSRGAYHWYVLLANSYAANHSAASAGRGAQARPKVIQLSGDISTFNYTILYQCYYYVILLCC